ncbi:MAG: glutamine-hydrolyzing GMP synthase [Candidatus Cloacimonadota bacterium]|nr:glutamine-hydrolyzing GMP synthase [Candidatus Cloacimonadota bacterium]
MILIIDFGSQFTHLIAKAIEKIHVRSEIISHRIKADEIKKKSPAGIILSGSPSSTLAENSPTCDRAIFDLNIPILGICYGMQYFAKIFGGKVKHASKKEFGYSEIKIANNKHSQKGKSQFAENLLLDGINSGEPVWMSHGDIVSKIPPDFECIASSENAPFVAIRNLQKKIYGVQFHPEVTHTDKGITIFENFAYKICGIEPKIKPDTFVQTAIDKIKKTVADKKVILGLSGGVDSSVAAVLIYKAIGNNLIPILVDNGLMRKNEINEIVHTFENYLKIKLHVVYAAERFYKKLAGVVDPEKKRKIIGNLFVEIFEEEALRNKFADDVKFLAQGTLYPDIIESSSKTGSQKGPSVTIKSHHNVGGLPEKMNLKIIEPLKALYKHEVRKIGEKLGIPYNVLYRHPFPGPGLAVRIIGDITPKKVKLLQEVDAIFIEELRNHNFYHKTWQAFAVLLPIQSVGVMGDERTYENVCALRAVNSLDGMTADWTRIPYEILRSTSNRIINEVTGINRVVYDISSKPPSTIEWE